MCAGGGVALGEQDATKDWQEATPTAAKTNSRPINLRRELGMMAGYPVTNEICNDYSM
jgi:hypothetical protein